MSDYPPPPNQPGGYQQQPGYPPPQGPSGYGAPKNGMGTAALVLGILSIIPCGFGPGLLLAIPAIILGVVARGKAKRGEASNQGVATAGVITGIIGLVISLAVGALLVFGAVEFGDEINNFAECIEDADNDGVVTDAEEDECLDEF